MDRVDQKWQQLSKTAGGEEARPPTTFNEINDDNASRVYTQNTHSTKITPPPPNKNQEPADPTRILHFSNTFSRPAIFISRHNVGLCLEFASKDTSVRVAHCFVNILISLGNDISLGNIMCCVCLKQFVERFSQSLSHRR